MRLFLLENRNVKVLAKGKGKVVAQSITAGTPLVEGTNGSSGIKLKLRMALLQDILFKVNIRSVYGSTAVDVNDLQIDSRKVSNGLGFHCYQRSRRQTGISSLTRRLRTAQKRLSAKQCLQQKTEGVTYVQVENSAAAAGVMAHNFYGQPSEKLKLVGVTGTNGKTTIATLLFKLFTNLGYKCGLLSTVQNHIGDKNSCRQRIPHLMPSV